MKKKLALIAIILMVVFSFAGLLTLLGDDMVNLTSLTLLVGIVFYFITREQEEKAAMSLKAIPKILKDWKMDLLILMPLIMDAICYGLAKWILPEFLEHLSNRIDFLSFDQILILIAELFIAAFGEEIAWRGFFLNKVSKSIPFVPALLITAALFSLCHFTVDSPVIVIYDLFFIVVNAVFYGLIFKKTNNIIVSTMSHLLANAFGVFGLFLVL